VPSIFDMTGRIDRPWLQFMHHFAANVSKPASSNAEIDYVPTLVFVEYLREEINDLHGRRIGAIRYQSSLHTGGVCWAVFVGPEGCGDDGTDALLALDPSSIARSS
jgi:hypothetical protein